MGRNVAKHLLKNTEDKVVIVDDLSVGVAPSEWLEAASLFGDRRAQRQQHNISYWGLDERLILWEGDFRNFLRKLLDTPTYLRQHMGLDTDRFSDVFHFAAIVGGRAKIDGDPMMVALDLSIDAEFFYWAVRHKPERVLYPSSSAAYPVNLQRVDNYVALSEEDIDFAGGKLGQPDMTYGWSKLTGEYLARIAAEHYGLSVTCVRPFSGYGEDQDLSYPIPAIAARAARKEDPFEVWGTGEQGRDFVHIDDCIDCMLFAMDRIKDGRGINIGSGEITNFLQIIELFASFAGYKPEIKKLLDKPVGVHARHADMSFVFNELGWQPQINLREGMRRVYDQALKNIQREKLKS